ncbi:MAG: NrfD/PsrC family molybdoenzyme membrane anchor subunit [Thermodesulfobacteriota bacterium]
MVEVREIYNVHHEMPLGILIATYFYFTGLSAGSFILSTLAYGFGIQKYTPISQSAMILATVLLLVAPINLVVDLEPPIRFYHLFVYFNFTSPITYGSFLLTIYPISCIVYGYFMFRENVKVAKICGLIGIPLALLVHGYTGFIMALGKARILWNTALMPTIFLVSAMVSGIALMILVVLIMSIFKAGQRDTYKELTLDLGKILVLTIVTDLTLIGSDIIILLTSHHDAYHAAMLILKGSFAPMFLGVEIILGSIIPLILLLVPYSRKSLISHAVASVLVMIGIYAMRYVMVVGGQSLPLS